MSRLEGTRFRDPASDETFTVTDAPTTTGLSVAEMDRQRVTIEYDDGETRTVPHERFRGRMTYERVDA
jgi:formate hydrogenlyase subunit 6/NADH:ubiquinone oxidoreductase subunit I